MILKDVSQETLVFPLLTIGKKLHMEHCISWDNGATKTWGITKLGSTQSVSPYMSTPLLRRAATYTRLTRLVVSFHQMRFFQQPQKESRILVHQWQSFLV